MRTYLEKFQLYLECEIRITTVRAVLPMKKSCLTRINLSSLEPPPGRRHRSHTCDRRRNSKLLPLSNPRPAENNSRWICRNSEPEISAICACLRRGGAKIAACVSVKRMIRHARTAVLTPLSRFLSEGGQRTLQIEQ